jgi:response regulator RpfG family c-di-GMP phosphodiesterase
MLDSRPERDGHSPAPQADGAAPSVLVVVEDPGTRQLCHQALDGAGYRVEQAADASYALEKLQRRPVDVIVMDAALHEDDGVSLLDRLQADPATAELPTLLLESRGGDEARWPQLEPGSGDVVVKPVRPAELLFRLRCLEELRGSRTSLREVIDLRSEQSRMLSLLLELSRTMASAAHLDGLLDRIVDVAAEMTLARRAALLLPDPERKQLTVACSLGLDTGQAGCVGVPMDSGHMLSRIYRSPRTAVITASRVGAADGGETDPLNLLGIPALCIPLRAAESAVGVLALAGRHNERRFEGWELEFLDLLCNIAGTAIAGHQAAQAREVARDSIVTALATLAEYRDNETGRHVERVTQFSLILARELRAQGPYRHLIDDGFMADLRRATPLHDIGKVAIPDAILLKPGRLTEQEMNIVRRHAAIGRDAIRDLRRRTPGVGFLQMAEEIAGGHHEWFNGGGYPDGLAGDAIPLAARVVALADVYDALTSRRVYKGAISHERALGIIQEHAGTQFDPVVEQAFQRRREVFRSLALELSDVQSAAKTPAAA